MWLNFAIFTSGIFYFIRIIVSIYPRYKSVNLLTILENAATLGTYNLISKSNFWHGEAKENARSFFLFAESQWPKRAQFIKANLINWKYFASVETQTHLKKKQEIPQVKWDNWTIKSEISREWIKGVAYSLLFRPFIELDCLLWIHMTDARFVLDLMYHHFWMTVTPLKFYPFSRNEHMFQLSLNALIVVIMMDVSWNWHLIDM